MIRAVIFDMDGLMYDTEPLVESCWKKAARHTRVVMTPQTLAALRSRRPEEQESYLRGIFGDRVDFHRLEQQMRREMRELLAGREPPQKPGLWELLVYLQRNGYRMAVQTFNDADTAAWYLAQSGCAEFFSAVVHGGMLHRGGPSACQLAADMLQLSPQECLVLDDSPVGIAQAQHEGFSTVMIPDLDAPPAAINHAGALLQDMEQVIPWLEANGGLPPQKLPPVDAVVFDLGGVVVQFDPVGYLRRRFANRRIEEYMYQHVFASDLWRQLDAGQVQRAQAEQQWLAAAAKDGLRFEMQTVLDEWCSHMRTRQDTAALIRQIRASGCRAFYLSNIAQDTWQMLQARGIPDMFDGGVTSWELGVNKPDPAIFRCLLEKYGLQPAATIFFDDTLENVQGARALGIIGLHFHSAALAKKNLEGYQVF